MFGMIIRLMAATKVSIYRASITILRWCYGARRCQFLLPALIWRAHQQFRLARKINCAHVLPKVVLDFVRAVPSLWHGRRPVRMSSIARYWALPPPD